MLDEINDNGELVNQIEKKEEIIQRKKIEIRGDKEDTRNVAELIKKNLG